MARNSVKVSLSVTISDLVASPDRLESYLREQFVDSELFGLNPWTDGTDTHAVVIAVDVLDAEVVEDQGDDNNADETPATLAEALSESDAA